MACRHIKSVMDNPERIRRLEAHRLRIQAELLQQRQREELTRQWLVMPKSDRITQRMEAA